MLAANLDLSGSRGMILEGSRHVGSKLLMSGGGRCNISHGGSMKDMINAYGSEGPSLRRCLYRHSNLELAQWFDARGVSLAAESGAALDLSLGMKGLADAGRIFPASMRARDILDALLAAASANGWRIETEAKVSDLKRRGDRWEAELPQGSRIEADHIVVAAGGITYPGTGSDGSMHRVLERRGIAVTPQKPALAPVYVEAYPYAALAGISIPDVTVTAFGADAACTCKGKAARMRGSLLFTHDGFSGPVILDISKYAEPGEIIRLCYNKELAELPKRMQKLLKDRAKGPRGDVRTAALAGLLNQDDFRVKGTGKDGMVTAGGVSLEETDLSSMRVKRADGLYVIGEALDADGMTGGYNLQMCWSTACAAADDLRKRVME